MTLFTSRKGKTVPPTEYRGYHQGNAAFMSLRFQFEHTYVLSQYWVLLRQD